MNVHQATVKDAHHKPWGDRRRSPVVMVLQNERFYADFLEEMLVALGFSVGGAFCSCQEAEEWLKSEIPDVAVIDAEVQDGRCRDIAGALRALGVPFVVYSNMPIVEPASGRILGHGTFLKKPSSQKKLLAAVRAAVAQR
jgi:DNA-binding response OmpR family regulator